MSSGFDPKLFHQQGMSSDDQERCSALNTFSIHRKSTEHSCLSPLLAQIRIL